MQKEEHEAMVSTLKNLAANGEYKNAARLADEVEWRKEKDNQLVCLAAQVYENAQQYDKAKELLTLVYNRTPLGRQIAYRLCSLCIKMGNLDDAKEYYLDFVDMAPMDSSKLILEYQLAKAKGEPAAHLIDILKKYVDEDFEEKWGYELAKLYAEIGDEQKCVEICDELSLWFHDGKYVVKALGLKSKYQPLTTQQQSIYDEAMRPKPVEIPKPEVEEEDTEEEDPQEAEEETEDTNAEENPEEEGEVFEEKETYSGTKPPELKKFEEEDPQPAEKMASTASLDEAIAVARALADMEKEKKIREQKDQPIELDEEPELILNDTVEDTGFDEKDIKPDQEPEEEKEDSEDVFETKDQLPEPKPIEEEAPLFTTDTDGQISMDIPDVKPVEKQITGQLAINEVLKELESRGILQSDTVNKAIDVVNESTDRLPELNLPQDEQQAQQDPLSEEPEKSFLDRPGDMLELNEKDLMNDAERKALKEKELQRTKELEVNEVLKLVNNMENKEEKSTSDFDIPDTPETGKYYLDDRYREKFAQFLTVTGLENDLARTIYNLREHIQKDGSSRTNNVIVTGETKSGKTTLAADIIKVANKERGRKGRKIAKISSMSINKKGLQSVMPKLLGCDLIIENAGILNPAMITQLTGILKEYTDNMIVVMEDDKITMDRLLELHPILKDIFTNVINIKQYDIDEWVDYAKAYAHENGYEIDDIGVLALYARIDSEYGYNRGLEKEDVEDIMNLAMDKADGKGIGKLFKRFKGGKDGELKIIHESDFE